MTTRIPSKLDPALILDQLPDFYTELRCLGVTASTNEVVKDAYLTANEGLVVTAEGQTSGKGRNGRSFHSPLGAGLYVSILLKPGDRAGLLNELSLMAPLAMAKSIEELSGLAPLIKWPNDLWLDQRKIAGVLIESRLNRTQDAYDYIVVGIGVNVHHQSFPDEIAEVAGSLADFTSLPLDRSCLLNHFLRNFHTLYLKNGFTLEDYRQRMFPPDTRVHVTQQGETYQARILDLSPQGTLLVRLEDGSVRELVSGEIHLRPLP